jgi:hypothetical protein
VDTLLVTCDLDRHGGLTLEMRKDGKWESGGKSSDRVLLT